MPRCRKDWYDVGMRESEGLAKELDAAERSWVSDMLHAADLNSAAKWTERRKTLVKFKYQANGYGLVCSWRCSRKNDGCRAVARLLRKRSRTIVAPNTLVVQRAGEHMHVCDKSDVSDTTPCRGVPQFIKDILAPHVTSNASVGYLDEVLRNTTGKDFSAWGIKKQSVRQFRRACTAKDHYRVTNTSAIYAQLYHHRVQADPTCIHRHQPGIVDWMNMADDDKFVIVFATKFMVSLLQRNLDSSTTLQIAIDSTYKVVDKDAHKLLSISIVDRMHQDFPIVKALIHEECKESIQFCLTSIGKILPNFVSSLRGKDLFFLVDGSMSLRAGIHCFCQQEGISKYTILNCYAHLWRTSGVKDNTQLGKVHSTLRSYVKEKNNHPRMVADLSLITELGFTSGREDAIALFKEKWTTLNEIVALKYLERNTLGKDTRTWAHCDRKELFVARSNQGGERNHQVFKTILRGKTSSTPSNGRYAGKKYRRPLNEVVASMLDPHTLGALSRSMEVERRMQLDVRYPSTREIEAVERFGAVDSQFMVLRYMVWKHGLAFFPSIEYIKMNLINAREVLLKGRMDVLIHPNSSIATTSHGDKNPEDTTTFMLGLPNTLDFMTQESIEAKQLEEVEGFIKRRIYEEASTISLRKHLQSPRTNDTFDSFKKRTRSWQCCVELDGEYWMQLRGTCEEYHMKGYCIHSLYVLRRNHTNSYQDLLRRVGKVTTAESFGLDFAGYSRRIRALSVQQQQPSHSSRCKKRKALQPES